MPVAHFGTKTRPQNKCPCPALGNKEDCSRTLIATAGLHGRVDGLQALIGRILRVRAGFSPQLQPYKRAGAAFTLREAAGAELWTNELISDVDNPM